MAEEIRQPGVEVNLIVQSPEAGTAILPCDRADWSSFGITMTVALLAYLSTLPPNVTLEWSGILSVGAQYAGVAPPPGYPAWTIYSWLFVKLLPFSNIAWRVAVGSAVATAVACGLIALIVSRFAPILFSETPAFVRLKLLEQKWLRAVCGGVAGLILAFSHVVWENAVVADIWGLSLLLFVGALCLLSRWMLYPAMRWLLLAAFFLFGLLLTSSQQMIIALPGLVCAVMLLDRKLGRDLAFAVLPLATMATGGNQSTLWIDFPSHLNWPISLGFVSVFALGLVLIIRTRRVGSEWKSAMLCGAGLILGLALYLYVPVASMSNPPVNWGYPRTVEGFLHVLTRGQFERASPTSSWDQFGGQLLQFASFTTQNIGWPCLTFVALSIWSVHRMSRAGRRWMLGLLAVWICVGPLMVAMLNPPLDRQAQGLIELYFAEAYAVLALWAGAGMIWLGAMLTRTDEKHPAQVPLRAE